MDPLLRAAACPDCGTVHDHILEAIRERNYLKDAAEQQEENLQLIEKDVRKMRREIARLREQQAQAEDAHPRAGEIRGVLAHWKAKCAPRAKELTGSRFRLVLARLNGGWTAEELKAAVDGYALFPYVMDGQRRPQGPAAKRYVDAGLIFRDSQKVENGLELRKWAAEAQKKGQMSPAVAGAGQPTPADVPAQGHLPPLGQQAVALAELGFYVFPCIPRDKRPATPNGLKDAKRDTAAIAKYWSAVPDANIGIRCGAESGIVVLDVDGDQSDPDSGHAALRRLEAEHGDLPTTASVVTPSGGAHYYFQHPGETVKNTQGFPAPGLDLRGDGGYVLAVGSVHPNGGTYEQDEEAGLAPMPGWLLARLKRRDYELSNMTQDEWVAELRKPIGSGERNGVMTRIVGKLFNAGNDAGMVMELAQALNAQNSKPPMSAREVAGIVKSIAGREARKAEEAA